MLKVTIHGEVFPFDADRYPLSEAIDLEEKLGMPFREWRNVALPSGSAKALAGLIWLVLKRNGRDTTWEDITSGTYELSENDIDIEQEGGEDPTEAPSPADASSTSEPSPTPSGTPPETSTDSPSTSSTSSSAT
jgi:hypothetical protein